jgi:hypothetical protein
MKITVYPIERITLNKALRGRFLAALKKRKIAKTALLREALIEYLDRLDREEGDLKKEGRGA